MNTPVKVFTKNNCTACIATKSKLEYLQIPFEVISIEGNVELQQQLVDDGWRAMPVVITENDSWAGYKPDKINSLI
jgi:glutaredoxin-like protein NrdH